MPLHPTDILLLSRQFGRYYVEQFSPMLERTGLSINEIHVLLFLVNNPAYNTARDVTELRGLGKSQVSQAVELLAGRGLLTRIPDGEDRRVVHLILTEAGRASAGEAREIQAQCGRQLTAELTDAEQAQLDALLNKIADNAGALAKKGTENHGTKRH